MCKVLNLSLESLKKFNRLYIKYEEYNNTYENLLTNERIENIEKIRRLVSDLYSILRTDQIKNINALDELKDAIENLIC